MAKADPITLLNGQKALPRRTVLGALPLALTTLALPFPASSDTGAAVFDDGDDDMPHPVLQQPFVREATERRNGAPRCFWAVSPTGDYADDCRTGDRYARLALDYMVRERSPQILQWAVFDMMRLGRAPSGVEVGFLSHFGHLATEAHAARLARGEGVLK